MDDFSCPACGSTDVARFFEARGVPAHSVLLMPTREVAVGYPRRDIELGFCRTCGFIANIVFDAGVQEYSDRYEETQGFSPTFRSWLEGVADRLIRDYDIRNKEVCEIGCGKGDFLALMCERGGNRGVGIDPAYVPGRLASEALPRMRFERRLWDESFGAIEADAICCRHTLEHIAPVKTFLTTLRRALGERTNALVFFELPETLRVLREGAFWDIYYEHCSYFTPGSLARLFRAARFDILELWLDYDDQYILLIAKPSAAPTCPALAMEDDLEETARAAGAFSQAFGEASKTWRARAEAFKSAGRRGAIWGSGSKTVSFLTMLGFDGAFDVVVDINPHKQGNYMPATGQRVVAPEHLRKYRPDFVIVANPVYREEIRRHLESMNLRPEILTF